MKTTPIYTYIKTLAVIIILSFLSACGGVQPLREVLKKQTAYERYEQSLKNAKLETTALGKDWLEAGRRAFQDSLFITLPYKETGYFSANQPMAISYRLKAKRGDRLIIGTEIKSSQPVKVFLDIFELDNKLAKAPKHVASADTGSVALSYEVEEDNTHLIRLQPELLRSGNYTISITREPTLAFPVSGKNSRQVSSFWGVPRDGGARKHEGVDIFAKRGTPAIAAVDGYISAVNENRLGGKVVWLVDEKRRQTLYYAHLDSQMVHSGQQVSIGDTIGLIGNTGNARTTAPHLHFGIYRPGKGAFDPFPSLQAASPAPEPVLADMRRLATWARISAKKGYVRLSPDNKGILVVELPRHTPVYIMGGTHNWYKIQLPDNQSGYIASSTVENLEKPLRTERVERFTALLEKPDVASPFITELQAGSRVPVLADTGAFLYVKTSDGIVGWLAKATL